MMITESLRRRSRPRFAAGRLAWSGLCRLALPVASLLLAALILSVVLTRVPVMGYRAVILGGGSMEPAIDAGSLMFSRQTPPASLAAGDVITFRYPGADATITHRIVSVREESGERWFTVKGDANATVDPDEVSFSEGNAYKNIFAIPYAGRLLSIVSSRLGIALLVGLPLLGLAALYIFRDDMGGRAAGELQ